MKNAIKLTPAEKNELNETAIRTLTNALEVEDILALASKASKEVIEITARSEVVRRHLLTGKPTCIRMTPADAARSEELLTYLKQLGETYTDRMRAPAAHVPRNQNKKYRAAAVALIETDPRVALAKISKLMKFRTRFIKEGSVPVDFRDIQPSVLDIFKAAIKDVRVRAVTDKQDLASNDARKQAELNIDAAARVVENEANTSGHIGHSEGVKLNTLDSEGARSGAVVGTVANKALVDVVEGEKIKKHATPYDSLRTMRPGSH